MSKVVQTTTLMRNQNVFFNTGLFQDNRCLDAVFPNYANEY